jgi:RHS repeat-associated protein
MVALVGALVLSIGLGSVSAPAALPGIPAPALPSSFTASVAAPASMSGPFAADPHLAVPYFGARYYSSHVGRFTTSDPAYSLQQNLVDPQRWNKYAYARSNPLRYTDPDGKFILPVLVVVGVAAVYAVLASPDIANAPGPHDPLYKSDQSGKLIANAALAVMSLKALFPTEGLSPPDQRDARDVHSRYGDATPVFEGQQPARLPPGPDPDAGGPHTRLRRDTVNDRIYQGREFDANGNPVRDIDFTSPTYRNGRPRADHPAAPHQHPWVPNSPENPKAGFKRGAGEPAGQ